MIDSKWLDLTASTCCVQFHTFLNDQSWAVRAAAHITWTLTAELPSYLFSAEGMLAWDQAAVAAAMAPLPHAKLGINSTNAAARELMIVPSACVAEQQCAAPVDLFMSSSPAS